MTGDPAGEEGSSDTLIEEGLSSYVEAMIALGEFRREIHAAVGNVLNRRLLELTRSIGIQQDQVKPVPYANPEQPDDKNWDGNFAWIALRLHHARFDGYFGIVWRRSDGSRLQAGVAATFAPARRALYDQLRGAVARSHVENALYEYPNEITLWKPLVGKDAMNLERGLEKFIDDWISVWTSAGGLRDLERPA